MFNEEKNGKNLLVVVYVDDLCKYEMRKVSEYLKRSKEDYGTKILKVLHNDVSNYKDTGSDKITKEGYENFMIALADEVWIFHSSVNKGDVGDRLSSIIFHNWSTVVDFVPDFRKEDLEWIPYGGQTWKIDEESEEMKPYMWFNLDLIKSGDLDLSGTYFESIYDREDVKKYLES